MIKWYNTNSVFFPSYIPLIILTTLSFTLKKKKRKKEEKGKRTLRQFFAPLSIKTLHPIFLFFLLDGTQTFDKKTLSTIRYPCDRKPYVVAFKEKTKTLKNFDGSKSVGSRWTILIDRHQTLHDWSMNE